MKRRSDSILGRPAQTSRLGDTRTTETTCNRLCGHTTFNWSAVCWFCADLEAKEHADQIADLLPAYPSAFFEGRRLMGAEPDAT